MKKLLLAAAAVLAMTGAARGEMKAIGQIGIWELRAGRHGDSTHCVSVAEYKNETALVFGVNIKGESWLRIVNAAWRIPAGEYRVGLQIDSAAPGIMTGIVAGDGRSIDIPFEMNEGAFNLITKGAQMRLVLGTASYAYNLTSTEQMLPALVRCAGQLEQAANPFAGQPAPAPAATTNPFVRM